MKNSNNKKYSITIEVPSESINAAEDSSNGEYSAVCGQRYEAARRRYQTQFQNEAQAMVCLQPSALEAVRLERAFQRVTVWPSNTKPSTQPSSLTNRQKRRLTALVTQPRVTWP